MGQTRIIVFILLFISSLTSRIWLTLRHMELGSDKCYQLLAAKNLNEGNGYSLSVQDAGNLTETIYKSLSGWPPGYSLMIVFVEKFTNDYLQAALVLDVFSVIVLYLALLLYIIWYNGKIKDWMIVLALIFFGVSSGPFTALYSTDFLTVSFFVLAAVLFTRWLETAQKSYVLLVLFVLTALMLPFLRYGYYAMVFVFPVFLMCIALLKKERKYAIQSVLLGLAFVAFIAGYTFYQVNLSGQSNPMSGGRHINEDGVLYFSNLRYINAFLYNSLINDFFILNRLSGTVKVVYEIIKYTITFLMFAMVVIICINNIRKKRIDFFNVLSLLIMLINVAYLVLVSVKNKLDASEDGSWIWTYVKEFRYYAPAYFMTILFILYNYKDLKDYMFKFVNFIILPLMFIGIGYSSYTLLTRNPIGTYKRTYHDFLVKFDELKSHDTAGKLVVVNHWNRSVDNTSFGSLMQLYDYKVYHDFGYGALVRSTFVDSAAIINNRIDKFWNNTQQLRMFDTVYYIGNEEDLKKAKIDSLYYILPTRAPDFFSVSLK